MVKRLAAAVFLAFAALLMATSVAQGADTATPAEIVNSPDSVTLVFPAGSFAAQTEVGFSAVSGDSAPVELNGTAHSVLSDSLGGLSVSVRLDDVSASTEELTYSGVLANGEMVNGMVSIGATDTQNGFSAFLAQPTFVGISMGAFLWIAIAVAALISGLFALGRSRGPTLHAPGSSLIAN